MNDTIQETKIGTVTLRKRRKRGQWGQEEVRLTAKCDAAAITPYGRGVDRGVVVLSAFGPASTMKAIAAALNTDVNAEFDVEIPGASWSGYGCVRREAGYKVRMAKLEGSDGITLWHMVAVLKTTGLMLAGGEDEALWQELRSERYTVPVLREWLPYLREQFKKSGLFVELNQAGMGAAWLQATDEDLEKVVSLGLAERAIEVPGARAGTGAPLAAGLDGYLRQHGALLGRQAEKSLAPLHVPGRDAAELPELLRKPFEAQAHVIAATAKALSRQKAVLMVGEMGVGKTLAGQVAIHAHASGRPYRTLVFCPGQLVNKWKREIEGTIPGAAVTVINTWKDLLGLDRSAKPTGSEWFVISRDRAKLGYRWAPVANKGRGGYLTCPKCGRHLLDKDGLALNADVLQKSQKSCQRVRGPEGNVAQGCGEQLWQATREIDRFEPAIFIKRHLRYFFKYLILDEVHEEKGVASAQGNAAGMLISACRKVIALTGTLIGGYAEHLRPLLFRMASASLVEEGLGWSDAMPFSERYGRIETRITERSGRKESAFADDGEGNRMSRGSKSRNMVKSVRPGVMPPLFGRHLLDKAVFLGLSEVAEGLPELIEEVVPVAMDSEVAAEYTVIEKDLMDRLKQMCQRGDKRLLGAMLQTLLAYPDYPYGWDPVGYWEGGSLITVTIPKNLDPSVVRPKEQSLIDLCLAERDAGRKCWVYVQFNKTHEVDARLAGLLERAGLRVAVMKSSVEPSKREAWIAKNAPKADVIVSHPKPVETGLDFFDKAGTYNVPTVVFYETGYNLFTLRQAARRAWRIGQRERCKVVYFYYQESMQARAMLLMGRKLQAALSLEGQFSDEGLAALAGEDESAEMALAKSLADRLDEGDVRRAWGRTVLGGAPATTAAPVTVPVPAVSLAAATEPPMTVRQTLIWDFFLGNEDESISGENLSAGMKEAGLTIPAAAEVLGVTEYKVKKARKEGVNGAACRAWARAIAGSARDQRPRPASPRAGSSPRKRVAAVRRNGSPR